MAREKLPKNAGIEVLLQRLPPLSVGQRNDLYCYIANQRDKIEDHYNTRNAVLEKHNKELLEAISILRIANVRLLKERDDPPEMASPYVQTVPLPRTPSSPVAEELMRKLLIELLAKR